MKHYFVWISWPELKEMRRTEEPPRTREQLGWFLKSWKKTGVALGHKRHRVLSKGRAWLLDMSVVLVYCPESELWGRDQ